jgi:succinoglycan biosynthesis transport protein ExoP
MDILFLLKVMWRKKWLWIITPILASGAAFLFTLNQVQKYRASTQLSTGFTMNDQVHLKEEWFNPRDADIKFNNLLSSMNAGAPTNFVQYRLLLHELEGKEEPFHQPDPEKLQTDSEEIKYVKDLVTGMLNDLKPLSTSSPGYPVIRKFLMAYNYDYLVVRANLNIYRIPNTDFIQVDYVSDSPHLSALAANAFCEEFIRLSKSLTTERAGESVDFLNNLVIQKKSDLDDKMETQRLFKTGNNLFNVEKEGENKLVQLSDLEKQRDEIRSSLQRVELTRGNLNRQLNGIAGTTGVLDNQKIIELRNTINNLNDRYITGGQQDNALKDSISFLREQLRIQTAGTGSSPTTPTLTKAEIQDKLNDLEVEYQVARTNLITVEAKITSLQYSFSGYASKEAKLEAIQKDVDLASEEYLAAVAKFNEAKNRLLASNTLRQTSAAFPPHDPLSSKRLIIVGLAGFSSFSICIFIIALFEFLDQSLRSVDKFSSIVNLSLIGSIIRLNINNFNIPQIFNQTGNESGELFKSILRKIRHEVVSLNSQVFLITSLRKNEGKTFTIIALSYILSLVNKRVLIVDTNFRNNILSQVLPKGSKVKSIEDRQLVAGLLTSSKQGKADVESDDKEMAYELITPTIYKNVFVVTNAGGGIASPAEILSGRNFANLIEGFKANFDYIILEGGALNDYADTKELVQYVDKVITIFSAQSTVSQQDRESIQYIKSLGNKFGGCVLNKIDPKDYKS